MIKDRISELIPFISENFITYPLWEEGIYSPNVNFWLTFNSVEECTKIIVMLLETFQTESGYDYEYELNRKIINISIRPITILLEDGGYSYQKLDWSIEEIIELIKLMITDIKIKK